MKRLTCTEFLREVLTEESDIPASLAEALLAASKQEGQRADRLRRVYEEVAHE